MKANIMSLECSGCHIEIKFGQEHRHQSKVLWENCYMDIRITPARKTHWQYIGSIKADYLVLAAVDANVKQKSSCSGN